MASPPAGGDGSDPMILVSVMGTVQFGRIESKIPPDLKPFAQTVSPAIDFLCVI